MKLSGSAKLLFLAVPLASWAGQRPCVSTDQAGRMIDKDICISAHVYDVVQQPDGTRYLDLCSPDTSDEACRFTIVSLWQDRGDVGELNHFRDMDVQVRGIVQPMHGRAGIVLSHSRQFHGGPPKFRPNPRLARGFTAENDRPPVPDPNLRPQGRGRSFMNSRDEKTRPVK